MEHHEYGLLSGTITNIAKISSICISDTLMNDSASYVLRGFIGLHVAVILERCRPNDMRLLARLLEHQYISLHF